MAMNAIEIRLAHLEGAYEQIDRRLTSLEGRVDGGFAELSRKIDSVFFRLVAIMMASWITLMLGILEVLMGHR